VAGSAQSALPGDVLLGAGVVVAPDAQIGAGCAIEDHAVLGKRPILAAGSRARASDRQPVALGERVTIGTAAVIFDGVTIESDAAVGDQANIRERTVVAARAEIGRGTALGGDVRIGAGARVGGGCWLTTGTVVEAEAVLGARVVTTNDHTMARLASDRPLRAPVVRRGCTIGAGAVLLPGVELGAGARIAAGSVVTRDVAPGEAVSGAPAEPAQP
jgi:acetyltransferase-like isoleucine patch superfamily enzyme